jgi:hypothetical protein
MALRTCLFLMAACVAQAASAGHEEGDEPPALSVRVVDAHGKPVSLANLTLWSELKPGEAEPVNQLDGSSGIRFYDPVIWDDKTHDARWIRAGSAHPNDGRHGWEETAFHFYFLEPGRYCITAVTYRSNGETPDPTPYGISNVFTYDGTTPVATKVSLTAGKAECVVRLVDSETHEPIPGMAIRLRTAQGMPIVHGRRHGIFFDSTSENGEVRYAQLKPGDFSVEILGKRAEVNNFVDYEPFEEPMSLTVEPGANSFEMAIKPRRLDQPEVDERFPFSVFGRVTDEQGTPISGVLVRAATGMATLLAGGKTRSDVDGRYRLYFSAGWLSQRDEAHPLGVGVQAVHFSEWKAGWELAAEDGDLSFLMTDQTPAQFEALLKKEGGQYWGKSSADEVIFAGQPRELNLVLKRSE